MSEVFNSILTGFEQFAEMTNNENLIQEINKVRSSYIEKNKDINMNVLDNALRDEDLLECKLIRRLSESSKLNETTKKMYTPLNKRDRIKYITLVTKGLMEKGYSHEEANGIALKQADEITYPLQYSDIETVAKHRIEKTLSKSEFENQYESYERDKEFNPFANLRSNVIEYDDGDYFYIEYRDGKMIAGGATNDGIMTEFELDYDNDLSVDENIQRLYDYVEEHKDMDDFSGDELDFDFLNSLDKSFNNNLSGTFYEQLY